VESAPRVGGWEGKQWEVGVRGSFYRNAGNRAGSVGGKRRSRELRKVKGVGIGQQQQRREKSKDLWSGSMEGPDGDWNADR